jgi:multidrug efflux pump subunit AcrA (membrane-fusion protein)
MLTEVSQVREVLSADSASGQQRVEALREELDAAKNAAARSAGQARIQAQKHAEKLAAKLAEEQKAQEEHQQQMAAELNTQIDQVKQSAGDTDMKVNDVSKEMVATKDQVNGAVADLKRMTGDMGVMSGLIATNSTELDALKKLGEKNYFEFNLTKTKQPQKVGDVKMLVKKTDPKRNKYTVELLADDKTVEKKDKNTNEPVQFYLAGSRQPCEIVVNQVSKDRIVGYLATPKVQIARK